MSGGFELTAREQAVAGIHLHRVTHALVLRPAYGRRTFDLVASALGGVVLVGLSLWLLALRSAEQPSLGARLLPALAIAAFLVFVAPSLVMQLGDQLAMVRAHRSHLTVRIGMRTMSLRWDDVTGIDVEPWRPSSVRARILALLMPTPTEGVVVGRALVIHHAGGRTGCPGLGRGSDVAARHEDLLVMAALLDRYRQWVLATR